MKRISVKDLGISKRGRFGRVLKSPIDNNAQKGVALSKLRKFNKNTYLMPKKE